MLRERDGRSLRGDEEARAGHRESPRSPFVVSVQTPLEDRSTIRRNIKILLIPPFIPLRDPLSGSTTSG